MPPPAAEPHYIGITQLARLLGVSKSRADQLAREPGFPTPQRIGTQAVRIWDITTIREWARTRAHPRDLPGDTITPKKRSPSTRRPNNR